MKHDTTHTTLVPISFVLCTYEADAEPEDPDLQMLNHLGIKLPDDGEFLWFLLIVALSLPNIITRKT